MSTSTHNNYSCRGTKDVHDAEAEGDTEERVADLEDALDELKAEFEKMMSGKMGDEEGSEEEKEEESVAPVADPNAELSMEAKKDDKKKEKMDEYKIQKSADNKDHADNKKSPVANKNDMGGNAYQSIIKSNRPWRDFEDCQKEQRTIWD